MTGKHAKAINTAKGAEQSVKERKEQAERIKEQIEARKEYQRQYDSLKAIQINDFQLDSLQLDSLQMPTFSKEDSIAIAEQILAQPDMTEYRELLAEVIDYEEPDLSNADSVALVKAQSILEEHAQSFLPAELNQTANPLDGFANPLEGGVPDLSGGVSEIEKPTRPNPNLIKPEQARELFQKIDPEQFQEIQQDIKGLKEKYSELPDTRFPEEGIKRNSLQDVPFKKRLYFGGNFTIQSTDPFIIDANPQIGYWINKKWLAGAGVIFREQFGKQDSLQLLTGDAHGFSVFTRFDIKSGFFGRAELESQISKSLFKEEEEDAKSSWQNAYLIGLGREFNIGPVRITSIVLYDLNYKHNNLNTRPLVLKVGFELSKKPE